MLETLEKPIYSDSNTNAPWWIKAITIYGVPAVIALYLVYALVGGQMSILINIQETLYGQKVAIDAVAVLTKETAQAATKLNERQEYLLRQVCVNTSKNEQQRTQCLLER